MKRLNKFRLRQRRESFVQLMRDAVLWNKLNYIRSFSLKEGLIGKS